MQSRSRVRGRASALGWALSALLAVQTADAAAADPVATLRPVTVIGISGGQELAPAYAGGAVASGARLGALGNQSLMDTPFNVVSYTAELLRNQQARTLADVMANDPGVRFTTSNGHPYENFRLRGFDLNQNDVAIEGMYGLAPMGRVPTEFIERVEVLKGPSALFSGMAPSGAVGGTINLVPERAGDLPEARVGMNWQSDGQLGTSVDMGRRFGEGGAWGARINGSFSDGAGTLDGQRKKREWLSAAIDYRNADLRASVDLYHSQESFKGGTPAMYWFGAAAVPEAPDPRTNLFGSGYGSIQSNAIIGRVEYRLDDATTAFGAIGKRDSRQLGLINGTHARRIDARGNFTGMTVPQRAREDATSAELGVRTRFMTGGVGHELVVQGSRLDTEDAMARGRASTFRSNIHTPTRTVVLAPPASAPKTGESVLTSVALIDTVSMLGDSLRLTAGVRHQNVRTRSFKPSGRGDSYDESALTPALAVVVKPWGGDVSLYANYVQGLRQGGRVTDLAATNYGAVFAPYKTVQREVGGKWDAGTFTNTLAYFDISSPTMIVEGTAAAPSYSDKGEKHMRGLEWNAFGELGTTLRVLGGLAYTRGTQTRTSFGRYDGKSTVGTPRWQANMGLEWDTPWIRGLTLSGRVQLTSKQYVDAANRLTIPGWGQLDLGARYAVAVAGRDVVLRLNVNNVFDRHYYAGIFSDSTPIATLGLARTITASVETRF
ncbi:TonB-dependent siderophore receptor [Bordetella genomosp. 1]|uniref:TonB-dependent siderophore receptor n=1 Tax=Bordetella genomosp. 1 TaxID=1395607 RepID=A0A261S7B8_9BORD|nr:TonB-dependent siderophore receptor [Bordetella genomosp. 1]